MMTLSLLMLFKRNYEKETEDLKDRNRLTIGVEFTSDCSPLNHMNRVCPIEKAIIFHSDTPSLSNTGQVTNHKRAYEFLEIFLV